MDKGPELLKEILSRLVVSRGWGRRQGQLHLERAWAEAVGAEHAKYTRVIRLRKNILEVEVANSVLLQELAHFHKRKIIQHLREKLTGTTVNDIRFKAGSWKVE
jgi:predicted nucleic acid-binding Zn ribbon protein